LKETRTLELVLGFKLLADRQCPDAFSNLAKFNRGKRQEYRRLANRQGAGAHKGEAASVHRC
jgi:hypothetical protein